jgi:hypothetical protein
MRVVSVILTCWRRRAVQTLVVLGVVSILGLSACSSTPPASANQPIATPTQTSKPTSTPSTHKLSASQKQQVSADLNAGLAHYVDAWHQGQQILGTTQYVDANAGLSAMDDPNSAASKFSAWRKTSGIEQDVNTYLNAFKSADAFYSADTEPQAISSYEDDMGALQADISTWVTDAVGWQIHTTDNPTMTQDVKTINTDISQVQADITATIAAS